MTIHVGIIGGGNISETHARAAQETAGVSIAAIYGMNQEKVARMATQYQAAAYGDFEKFLLHKPMDFVAIGSPSGLHAEQGIAAARRGLHVLTEKPLDVNTRRADEFINATSKAGVKLCVFFQDRFGLIAFDRATFVRSVKPSAHWLGRVAQDNGLRD